MHDCFCAATKPKFAHHRPARAALVLQRSYPSPRDAGDFVAMALSSYGGLTIAADIAEVSVFRFLRASLLVRRREGGNHCA